ncbi:MAG: hypothetical protein Q9160_001264 [Pyrenula sp. 1 TL-2023]
MSGGSPYVAQSPTQASNRHLYSPTTKSTSYLNNEPYHQDPRTPPSYPAASFARSPHEGHVPSLPALNGLAPTRNEASPRFHDFPAPSELDRHHHYRADMTQTNQPTPYANSPPSHAHPPNPRNSIPQSPARNAEIGEMPRHSSRNGYALHTPPGPSSRPSSQEKPARTNDPMSLTSILAGPEASQPSQTVLPPLPKASRTSKQPLSEVPQEPKPDYELKNEHGAVLSEIRNGNSQNGVGERYGYVAEEQEHTTPRLSLTAKENARAAEAMDAVDAGAYSDIEDGEDGYSRERELFRRRQRKRFAMTEHEDDVKRKQSFNGYERFRFRHEAEAQNEVRDQEIKDEKERKKDMQRKRRRENTIRQEEHKKAEAEERANNAEDTAEKEKLLREAEKASKKIRSTKRALERGNAPEEISEVPPLAPNLEGGTTSSFHIGKTASPEPPKKKQKQQTGPVTRPKKSKEKKQAEKEAAEAAYAAMEKEEPLIRIAPKEEPRRDSIKKESKASRASDVAPPPPTSNYDSKGYQQIYEQIWRDLARKDVGKVHRIKTYSRTTREDNLRKTVQLASKQARKWQERTNKSMKDTQARAKRTMREMMAFWKKNEREERDLRRMAERKEIEDAKKAEADREANRQKRKLNFLISQTELYSHFIGRKIKTDEVERATDDPEVASSGEKIRDGKATAHTVNLPESVADVGTKVTNFEDLDFDAEDETTLKQAAMANAQNAIQEAQDKARAFNNEENQMAAFDETELNFQNPTSLGDVQVAQPKMLQAQLKEYQLKGLNWLVNLYEQGINGILADEMGLGKTVQSISVMGYLAEMHNIWGPFLVIAPSSTLHNWQQEIARFVPSIKVLPYWGNAKDRKILRKFWDRKHITYSKDSEFHVLVTSYQLVVQDSQYFQKVRWQYMILDEAQAIKSSNSSRWKVLLGFHCRNRLLLTGTPIQNNMQELWALLHFIMPTLFDSHDEFSDWFSKDIESHAQSNTKLNQDQLKRLHMILKPFMLRRVKAHVQKELGDKVEKDVFCDLTYRQRAYYSNLRSRISIMDLIEKATLGDDQDAATLMNLVMQFRKVCNHPDLFERADTTSPYSNAHFAETASFVREGQNVFVGYSVRNVIEYELPRLLCSPDGRIAVPGPSNPRAGFEKKYFGQLFNIWTSDNVQQSWRDGTTFSFLRFANVSAGDVARAFHQEFFDRIVEDVKQIRNHELQQRMLDDEPTSKRTKFFDISSFRKPILQNLAPEGHFDKLFSISESAFQDQGLGLIEPAARSGATAPPIQIVCSNQDSNVEQDSTLFNARIRQALDPLPVQTETALFEKNVPPRHFPEDSLLPPPVSRKGRYTQISVPSMRRFVTDSGKLGKLDQLLRELKNGGHRVLLYFQMTRMIDLMEEYLTYRNYKYCRLDGSTKLEDRRDTVHDFQTRSDIFVFLLSTRAGGLGINLTSADTVIFYDSDWNPTIDSQAMDRAHRLGQTRQVTVYRMITRGTIEERIRKRALQKEEVQRVVISGGAAGGVDFNTRNRENRTKDIAMWLADDDQAAMLEQREKEAAERPAEEETKGKRGRKAAAAAAGGKKKRGEMSLDDMYHEGEGHFEDASAKPSGAATPVSVADAPGPAKKGPRGGKGISKKAKSVKERLRVIDADGDLGMGGL